MAAVSGKQGAEERYSAVTLQPHHHQPQHQPAFWTLREKERSASVLADRSYKQLCRSRKFK